VVPRRRDVEVAFDVEAEPVTPLADFFRHPLGRTVEEDAQQPLALDDHNRAIGLERDPVAVVEPRGDH
jgi:hypothetical protein